MFRLLLLCGAMAAAYVFIPRDPGDLSTDQLAQAAQQQLPIAVGRGAQVVAIRAEGQTLLFHIDGPAGWLRGMSRDEVAGAIGKSLCGADAFRQIIGSGTSIRADVSSDGGEPVPGDLITDCPNGSGGGT